MNARLVKTIAVGGAALIGAGVLGLTPAQAATASAAHPTPNFCPPDPYTRVTQVNVYYSSEGSAVGKYNGGSGTENLSYSMAQTIQRQTSLEAGASVSENWAMATVQANISYTITRTTSTSTTVSNTMNVPADHYGYMQPKAEFRTYHITQWATPGNCSGDHQTADYGYLDAIVASPFFSECTSSGPCAPRP